MEEGYGSDCVNEGDGSDCVDEEDGSYSVDGLECVGLGVREGGVVCRGEGGLSVVYVGKEVDIRHVINQFFINMKTANNSHNIYYIYVPYYNVHK